MIYLATQTGLNKAQSEDRILCGGRVFCDQCATLPLSGGPACVADGVGGHAGGGVASDFATRALAALPPAQFAPEALAPAILGIHQGLLEQGRREPAFSRMATTLTGVYLGPGPMLSFHVGNTRATLWDGKRLWQLTTDHTRRQLLRSQGLLEEAARCNQNEITNCLGGGKEALAGRLTVAPLPTFRTLLLTSDGIHDHVPVTRIESILASSASGADKCQSLLSAALSAGSRDDLSALLICLE